MHAWKIADNWLNNFCQNGPNIFRFRFLWKIYRGRWNPFPHIYSTLAGEERALKTYNIFEQVWGLRLGYFVKVKQQYIYKNMHLSARPKLQSKYEVESL